MVQKPVRISKHGNCQVVTIPRALMHAAGYELGDLVVCELTEQKNILFRRATVRDLTPERIRQFLPLDAEAAR